MDNLFFPSGKLVERGSESSSRNGYPICEDRDGSAMRLSSPSQYPAPRVLDLGRFRNLLVRSDSIIKEFTTVEISRGDLDTLGPIVLIVPPFGFVSAPRHLAQPAHEVAWVEVLLLDPIVEFHTPVFVTQGNVHPFGAPFVHVV